MAALALGIVLGNVEPTPLVRKALPAPGSTAPRWVLWAESYSY